MFGALTVNICLPPKGHGISYGMWAHQRTCWLKNWFPDTTRHHYYRNSDRDRQRVPKADTMINLVGAIIALVLWLVGTFLLPVGLGLIHILLATGVVLLIRWWALRPAGPRL